MLSLEKIKMAGGGNRRVRQQRVQNDGSEDESENSDVGISFLFRHPIWLSLDRFTL